MSRCAFDIDTNTCFVLIEKKCLGCSFYKTTKHVNQSRAKAAKRLAELPGGYILQEKYHKNYVGCEVYE